MRCVQVRCDQQIRAAVAAVRRTICDVQIKEEVVVKKVKKDEALANYKLQMANLLQTESRIRRLFRDVDQVFQKNESNRRASDPQTRYQRPPHTCGRCRGYGRASTTTGTA